MKIQNISDSDIDNIKKLHDQAASNVVKAAIVDLGVNNPEFKKAVSDYRETALFLHALIVLTWPASSGKRLTDEFWNRRATAASHLLGACGNQTGRAAPTIRYTTTCPAPIMMTMSTNTQPPACGPFRLNEVALGDCLHLIPQLPDESIDVLVTSPPYWGQRLSTGTGVEDDPRDYVKSLIGVFTAFKPKLKRSGLVWINIGDAYNTPVNWRLDDRSYSSLGPDKAGLKPENSAYTKPRAKRKAFIDDTVGWLQYGNLLSLPYRLVLALCDGGYLSRGEVIWRKRNPMPEGRCRRPHRQHEPIYLLAVSEDHEFRVAPPVPSVWEFGNEKIEGLSHFSRFPEELPRRCIEAYGKTGEDVVVFDPFSGSGTTGIAALKLGCSYVGFEIDPDQVAASNERIRRLSEKLSDGS